jgi:hypothetical protein
MYVRTVNKLVQSWNFPRDLLYMKTRTRTAVDHASVWYFPYKV